MMRMVTALGQYFPSFLTWLSSTWILESLRLHQNPHSAFRCSLNHLDRAVGLRQMDLHGAYLAHGVVEQLCGGLASLYKQVSYRHSSR